MSVYKKIIIVNVFGRTNAGDAALIESLVNSLQAVFGKDIKMAGLAVFDELEKTHLPEIEWYQRIGASQRERLITKYIFSIFYIAVSFFYALMTRLGCRYQKMLILLPKKQRESIHVMEESDIVISCPGGYFGDWNKSFLLNAYQLLIALLLNKPFILAPQTIGPISGYIPKNFLAYIFKNSKHIYVRETISANFLKSKLKISESKISLAQDMAFSHSKIDKKIARATIAELGIDPTKPFLGCSVVYWPFYRKDVQSMYEKKVAKFLALSRDLCSMPILIVNQVNTDIQSALRISALAGKNVIVDIKLRDLSVVKGMISMCKVFVGSRLHSSIFALNEYVPTYVLSYNYKAEGILNDIGISDRCINRASFNPDALSRKIKYDCDHFDDVSTYIKTLISAYKAKYPDFTTLLNNSLKEGSL
jgi:colanic acid/amylovoran biosynthesis protein